METQADKIIEGAAEHGFTDAAFVLTENLRFVHEYRRFCEENLCGNYNKNYACPPYSGTPAEMEKRARAYEHALVLCTRSAVKDAMDPAETLVCKKDHSKRSSAFIKKMKKEGFLPEKGLTILAGPCSLCSVCKMQSGEACVFPEEQASCLSAYCIDVGTLAKEAGIELSWTLDQVSFFSMYLFNN